MTPKLFLRLAIDPTLAWLGPPFESTARKVMLLEIALQETGLRNRIQVGSDGKPLNHLARGFFQFEGGSARNVAGVLRHPSTTGWLPDRIRELGYEPRRDIVHEAVAHNDHLATLMATALLWTHPGPLPVAEDAGGAWAYYEALWRPGRARPEAWPGNHALALRTVLHAGDD